MNAENAVESDVIGALVEVPLLDACEMAVCPCSHVALDHTWIGCEECACGRSGIHAVLASGVVTVQQVTPPATTKEADQ